VNPNQKKPKRIAIVGLGVAGSYLLNRLGRDYDVTGYEMQKEGEFSAVCAWGTSRNELSKIMKPLGIDFEKYVLFTGKEMVVDLGENKSPRRIPLIGLVTYDKHQLELDLTKGRKAIFGVKATPSLMKDENYDMIIDCTGLHRAFLPKITQDLWIPCVEYKVSYEKDGDRSMPKDDFYIKPFEGLAGYLWSFPLERGTAYVGAGDYKKRHNEALNEYNNENPGNIVKKIGRPIRISPPKYCEPFFIGNVVGCGESIGTVFPLLGEGIIPSLQCAQLLCENLDDLPRYRDEVLKKFEYFNYVYDLIQLKFEGKFSMVRHLPLMLRTYNAMKKMEDRFGLEVRMSDFKEIVSTY
jgi:flavin-dependent dehydrogenase